jgi:hypothetical protein
MAQSALESQTLGSFLVHKAWERGESPATMTHRVGLGWSIWTRDLDRSVGEDVIRKVGQMAKLTDAEVRSMTLTDLLTNAGVPTQRNGFQRWLNPVGIYHRRRLRYGQLYCPECLLMGRNYLPMNWRLGSTWLCSFHSRPLRDSCPYCDMPFAPYRHDALMIARCDRCTEPLFRGQFQTVSPLECMLQARVHELWDAALDGHGELLLNFHNALTFVARQHPDFRRAGEPWIYWRATERRELLIKVSTDTLLTNAVHKAAPANAAARGDRKPGRRRRCSLPTESESRAKTLLEMAERIKFPRRHKARIGKTA